MINQRYKKHHQTEQKNTTRFCGLRRAKAKLHSKSRLKRLQQHRPHQAVRAAGANQIYQIDQIDYDIDEVDHDIDHDIDQIDHDIEQIDHDIDQIDQIDYDIDRSDRSGRS